MMGQTDKTVSPLNHDPHKQLRGGASHLPCVRCPETEGEEERGLTRFESVTCCENNEPELVGMRTCNSARYIGYSHSDKICFRQTGRTTT